MKPGNSRIWRSTPVWCSLAAIGFLLLAQLLIVARRGNALHQLIGWSVLAAAIILLFGIAWRMRKAAGAKSMRNSDSLPFATEYPCLNRFFVSVRVFANDPTADIWVYGGPKLGYFINLGIAALTKEDASRLIKSHIRDGRVDWNHTTWCQIDRTDLRLPQTSDTVEPSVWYSSGRMSFS